MTERPMGNGPAMKPKRKEHRLPDRRPDARNIPIGERYRNRDLGFGFVRETCHGQNIWVALARRAGNP